MAFDFVAMNGKRTGGLRAFCCVTGISNRLATAGAAACAWLAFSSGVAAAPDIELGRYLAAQCLTCHRTATADGAAIPNIFGMAEPRFATLVKAYRAKSLPNPVMQAVAAALKDEDIEALAAYFARATKP